MAQFNAKISLGGNSYIAVDWTDDREDINSYKYWKHAEIPFRYAPDTIKELQAYIQEACELLHDNGWHTRPDLFSITIYTYVGPYPRLWVRGTAESMYPSVEVPFEATTARLQAGGFNGSHA